MFYKFIFIFTGKDHEFLVQFLPLFTRYQNLLQEEKSPDPEAVKETLKIPSTLESFNLSP